MDNDCMKPFLIGHFQMIKYMSVCRHVIFLVKHCLYTEMMT